MNIQWELYSYDRQFAHLPIVKCKRFITSYALLKQLTNNTSKRNHLYSRCNSNASSFIHSIGLNRCQPHFTAQRPQTLDYERK